MQLEQLIEDTRDVEPPEELDGDEIHQVTRMIEKQVDHLLNNHQIKNTHLEHELRTIRGSAARAKDLQRESVERKLEMEENQTDILHHMADGESVGPDQ